MLAGKVAVITGAAQGIGLATTHMLLKSGVKVGAIDICDSLHRTCVDLGHQYHKDDVLCLPCDVTDNIKLREVFQKTKDHYGSLDIVVNNAGIGDEINWEKTLKINLQAVIHGTYLAQEMCSEERGGVVINLASMAGLYPQPYSPVYCATKHGVIGFTRSLKYLAQTNNIRVNCICPFIADTELGRIGYEAAKTFNPAMFKDGLVSVDKIVEGIMQLITDTSRAGAVLRATPRGLSYQQYPEDRAAKL